MPHQRLLLKLKGHGIGNGMINWIEKWLIDRRQRVVVDGDVSTWKYTVEYRRDQYWDLFYSYLTISANMKVSEQCGIAAAKGNQILGLIRRNIVYKEKELIIPLYKTIVRPHLEYCIQAWRPYRKKDIDMLERVQRRATKMIPKLRNISYEMLLKECGLTTLETSRLRGDQIEVFKILNGYENIDRNIFFTVKEERRTRGHGVTLAKKQCRLDIRKFSFSQRTVNEWNR